MLSNSRSIMSKKSVQNANFSFQYFMNDLCKNEKWKTQLNFVVFQKEHQHILWVFEQYEF